jgi:hypothetical protein
MTNEGKSVRSRRVGSARVVCRAPCIRSLAEPTRLTRNTQTGSYGPVGTEREFCFLILVSAARTGTS